MRRIRALRLEDRCWDANVRRPKGPLVSSHRVHCLRLGGVSDLINLHWGDTFKTTLDPSGTQQQTVYLLYCTDVFMSAKQANDIIVCVCKIRAKTLPVPEEVKLYKDKKKKLGCNWVEPEDAFSESTPLWVFTSWCWKLPQEPLCPWAPGHWPPEGQSSKWILSRTHLRQLEDTKTHR